MTLHRPLTGSDSNMPFSAGARGRASGFKAGKSFSKTWVGHELFSTEISRKDEDTRTHKGVDVVRIVRPARPSVSWTKITFGIVLRELGQYRRVGLALSRPVRCQSSTLLLLHDS